ncbi:MAG: stage II sporulation protein P [Lachnospiraceae bacterium]|nr:stage II sporulation protein P [Butyrivibrio sp.]MCM1343361.1 stage II sporulation protein P [Muribaculaceae bacterium]MCM1410127.1 stage II sporulation protein P [Lachnospiraceae bacterium]
MTAQGRTKYLVILGFLILFLQAASESCGADGTQEPEKTGFRDTLFQGLAEDWRNALYGWFVPLVSFAQGSGHQTHWLLQGQIDSLLPFYGYYTADMDDDAKEPASFREILLAEAEEGTFHEEPSPYIDREGADGQSLEELLRAENEAAMQMGQSGAGQPFVPHTRQAQVDLERLGSYEDLVKEFYTIDANTMAGSDQLDVERLLSMDMTVSKESEGPQILIYHTHSQEAFADSVPGDRSTSIVGVGDRLAEILEDEYGYTVLHHTARYDTVRDDAYGEALPGIEQVLAENPSIQVIIDLHRDSVAEGTRLVTDLDGRPTARFMFFNGLSRTRKTGNIAYLYNENLDANLSFSFQMQLKAAEYYPGLTRKIYLKGYRYNMHLRPRSLLVELGAQNNTVEEAMNACDPLAHILDMVLSGQ